MLTPHLILTLHTIASTHPILDHKTSTIILKIAIGLLLFITTVTTTEHLLKKSKNQDIKTNRQLLTMFITVFILFAYAIGTTFINN